MEKEKSSNTFESVWVTIDKLGERLDSIGEKLDRVAERQAKTDLQQAKNDLQMAETDRLIKANAVLINGIGNNNGAAVEEYFYNALEHGNKKMFGEEFDDVFRGETRKTIKGSEDEYDIMLFNGRAVCIVEVKYKADSADVAQVLRKERTFRANFPEHGKKRLYLAMASMSFHPLSEKACRDNGIAVMKQVGGTIVVSDENLKVF
jgi:hypothetical protein